MNIPDTIIISRTDSIGDVVLTLPMAGILKKQFPDCRVILLGRNYTKDVVALSNHIDEFISWDELKELRIQERINFLGDFNADVFIHVFPNAELARLAKSAKIQFRIGASGRVYHYLTCNKIVPLSRRNSLLHEAQLNFKLLNPILGSTETPSFEKLISHYGFRKNQKPIPRIDKLIDRNRLNLILHPLSKGSAREWPLDHYAELIRSLPTDTFKLFVTGTREEGGLMKSFLKKNMSRITDLTGWFSLNELINFIQACDGLVAASTGPLHLAAAMGKMAVGIYPPIRPMHPGRWAPLGINAHHVVVDKTCNDCRKSLSCQCMKKVSPQTVHDIILKYARKSE